jgi:hypothetical protein
MDFNKKTCLLADRTGAMHLDTHFPFLSRAADEDVLKFVKGTSNLMCDLGDASKTPRPDIAINICPRHQLHAGNEDNKRCSEVENLSCLILIKHRRLSSNAR